jgi:hypothetical protein
VVPKTPPALARQKLYASKAMACGHAGELLLRRLKLGSARAIRYCVGFGIYCHHHRQRPTGAGG